MCGVMDGVPLAQEPGCNFLEQLDKEQTKAFRRMVIDMVRVHTSYITLIFMCVHTHTMVYTATQCISGLSAAMVYTATQCISGLSAAKCTSE